MARAIALWIFAAVLTLPFAVALDRRARRAGVSRQRRLIAFGLTMIAAPLGVGLWIGLVHRHRARS